MVDMIRTSFCALLICLGCSDDTTTTDAGPGPGDTGGSDARLSDVLSDPVPVLDASPDQGTMDASTDAAADASDDDAGPTANRIASLTCDESALEQAAEYEQLFFEHFDSFKLNVSAFGSTRTDESWFVGSYGGRTGGQFYFYKASVEALVRVMLLAEHIGGLDEHVQSYVEFANEILDDMIPKLLSGHGTEVALAGNPSYPSYNANSFYHANGARELAHTRHKYLDGSRALSFFGYAMWGVLQTEHGNTASNRERFEEYARDLLPALRHYASIGINHGMRGDPGFSHMAGHSAMAAAFLRDLGDYGSEFDLQINQWVEQVNENVEAVGWVGSDVGHATDSVSALFTMRDRQMAMEALSGQSEISDETIGEIGQSFDAMSDTWPGNTGVTPEHEHHFALTFRLSPAVVARLAAPTLANYPQLSATPTGSHPNSNAFVTVADAAYGIALRIEGDAPCSDSE